MITVTASATTGQINFTASAPNAANVATELWLQPLRNANRKPQEQGYRLKAYATFVTGPGLTHRITVPSGFYAAAYRFVNKLTGQTSQFVPITVNGMALLQAVEHPVEMPATEA